MATVSHRHNQGVGNNGKQQPEQNNGTIKSEQGCCFGLCPKKKPPKDNSKIEKTITPQKIGSINEAPPGPLPGPVGVVVSVSLPAEKSGKIKNSEPQEIISSPSDDVAKKNISNHKAEDISSQNNQEISYGNSGGKIGQTHIGTPKTTTSSVLQTVSRQSSFNKDDKNKDTGGQSEGSSEKVVRQTSFSRDDHQYTDTTGPQKTTKSSAENVARQPRFSKDDKYTGNDSPNSTFNTDDHKQTVGAPPKRITSSPAQNAGRQASLKKDDKQTDTTPFTSEQKFVKQISFHRDQTETGLPTTTKSSGVQKIPGQASFRKDDKHTNASPLVTTTSSSSAAQNVDRQSSVNKSDKYADASQGQKVVGQGSFSKDDKYIKTTSSSISSVGQNVVRKPSFNKDDKYMDSSVGQKFVRQVSFSKDGKSTDSRTPATTKSNFEHPELEEQRKGFSKQENKNQNQNDLRPSSSFFPNFSSHGELPKEQQKGFVKQESFKKDDRKTGPSYTGQASEEQQRGSYMQDGSNETQGITRPETTKITTTGSGQQASIPFSNQQKGSRKQDEHSNPREK